MFWLGVSLGILPLGEAIGSELPKHRSLPCIMAITFLVGFSVTVAELDVLVLSDQVDIATDSSIPHNLLVVVIGIGVGFFMVAAIVRIIYGFPIAYLLATGYTAILILYFFVPPQLLAVAFDGGGVATGPMAVTFLLSVAVGIAASIEGRDPVVDGFGLIALIALAPILFIMLTGLFLRLKLKKRGETNGSS